MQRLLKGKAVGGVGWDGMCDVCDVVLLSCIFGTAVCPSSFAMRHCVVLMHCVVLDVPQGSRATFFFNARCAVFWVLRFIFVAPLYLPLVLFLSTSPALYTPQVSLSAIGAG